MPITGAEVGIADRLLGWIARRRSGEGSVSALKHKQEVRDELLAHLPTKDQEDPEVVVVRLGDRSYPKPDTRLLAIGASRWFKFEVKDVHDRGLEVVAGIEFVSIKRGKATTADESTQGASKVFVVGRIPYDRIRYMDWKPDPAYGRPRLYVKYGRRGPCHETVLYEVPSKPGGYLYEIPDVKWKGEPSRRKRLRRKVLSVKLAHEDRVNMRKMRDGDPLI